MAGADIANSTIVITGASSGFGRGTALKLASMGAQVVIAARRTEVLNDLAREIQANNGIAHVVTADVSNPDDIVKIAETAVSATGRIDVWINNVGVGALGYFWDIPIEDHARLIDVNLKGLIYGAHTALQQFRRQGYGTLVNIGSIDSEVPLAFQASYAASKAAVLSLSRSLNQELRLNGDNHIKVATIMPWAVDTPWWTHAANYTGHEPRMAAMDDPSLVIDTIVDACTNPKEEAPVGWKAQASNASHHLFPDLTERLSGNIADKEIQKADPLQPHKGALFEPMADGTGVDGGIRARMEQEDAGRGNNWLS